MIVVHERMDAISVVEDFDGVVLFKGSRSYELEKLLPSWAVQEDEAERNEKC